MHLEGHSKFDPQATGGCTQQGIIDGTGMETFAKEP